ncbi:DNA adenine methylase [Aneurinibacillus aneurinilyticus]|jgi:DNA adenine methylase|uniref:DNA adenine methylase n=1 Tax=Aneurinibacillus aneurinilyticus TaxID=1391 RepID=UPI0023F57B12|nr:DNA adenine methylase [Aneurinibacillus aneurinilyticus]
MAYPRVQQYPGSKWSMVDWIINHMPEHEVYLETHFGSGAVYFTKQPAKIETINDVNGKVVNLFRTIREKPEELARLIEWTPWARAEYYESYEMTAMNWRTHDDSWFVAGKHMEREQAIEPDGRILFKLQERIVQRAGNSCRNEL